jgi:hypothetical protein
MSDIFWDKWRKGKAMPIQLVDLYTIYILSDVTGAQEMVASGSHVLTKGILEQHPLGLKAVK